MKNFKILPTAILFICITYLVNGQTEKGKLLLGSETKLNFAAMNSKWKSDDDSGENGKTFDVEFSPQVGIFVVDNLALGIELPVNYSLEKDDSDNKFHSSTVALAPYIRKYFGTTNIKPYVHGAVGVGFQKYGYDLSGSNMDPGMTPEEDFKSTIYLYGLGGGLAFFLNEKTSLDIGLDYVSSSVKPKDDNDDNYRSIINGIGLSVGFSIIL